MFCRYCGKEIMEGEVHDCEKKVVTDWKGMVFGFLKNPLDTMKETYGDGKTKERFIIGGVYYGVLFLSILALVGKIVEFSDAFVTALVLTLVFAGIKISYAGFLCFFGKENGATMGSILSQACLSTIPQTICIIVMVIFSLLGFYVGVGVALLLHLLLQMTMDVVLMECVFQSKKNFGYWMYVAFSAVLMCVLYIMLKSVLKMFIEELASSILGSIHSW